VLHEAENAWKPRKHEVDENEDEMAVLERKVRAILNKLTPQKFDKLVGQFKELEIDTSVKLELCMELVFEKVYFEQYCSYFSFQFNITSFKKPGDK
jgi:translation initiation factor 4G